MKKNSLWFLPAAVAVLVGCASDTSEGHDPSPPETEAPPVSTSGSGVVPKATSCIPQKIPVCDSGQVLTCYGYGSCRRCSCTW